MFDLEVIATYIKVPILWISALTSFNICRKLLTLVFLSYYGYKTLKQLTHSKNFIIYCSILCEHDL